jgi:hypothetical protein
LDFPQHSVSNDFQFQRGQFVDWQLPVDVDGKLQRYPVVFIMSVLCIKKPAFGIIKISRRHFVNGRFGFRFLWDQECFRVICQFGTKAVVGL